MTHTPQIDPEFQVLLARSEELLASIKAKRETEPFDWREMSRLNDELSQLLDKMTAMVTLIETYKK